MYYIFLDESGDLGFDFTKKKTTRNFVIAIILVDHKRSVEKLIKKIHRDIARVQKSNPLVLHATTERGKTIIKFVKSLAKINCKIFATYIETKIFTTIFTT